MRVRRHGCLRPLSPSTRYPPSLFRHVCRPPIKDIICTPSEMVRRWRRCLSQDGGEPLYRSPHFVCSPTSEAPSPADQVPRNTQRLLLGQTLGRSFILDTLSRRRLILPLIPFPSSSRLFFRRSVSLPPRRTRYKPGPVSVRGDKQEFNQGSPRPGTLAVTRLAARISGFRSFASPTSGTRPR